MIEVSERLLIGAIIIATVLGGLVGFVLGYGREKLDTQLSKKNNFNQNKNQ